MKKSAPAGIAGGRFKLTEKARARARAFRVIWDEEIMKRISLIC